MSFLSTVTENSVALLNHNKCSVKPRRFGKQKKRPYGDRNYITFAISALDYLGNNRIFARLAYTNEKRLGADIVAKFKKERTLIKLNPINAPIGIMDLANKDPSLIVVNSLEELTIYFGKKLSS